MGRDFSEEFPTDESDAVVLNETAAKALNLQNPLEAAIFISQNEKPKQIIGVVNDVFFRSLHTDVRPMIFFPRRHYRTHNIVVRIETEDIPSTLAFLKSEWKAVAPSWTFQYHFIDEKLGNLYRSEKKLSDVSRLFACLAVVISCLGLFGLTSFSAEQKTKEIGVRKILGATVPKILMLLIGSFSKLILFANILAWPIAFIIVHGWLQNFSYRISIHVWIFVISGIFSFVFAVFTAGYKSILAATKNPVDSLRYE